MDNKQSVVMGTGLFLTLVAEKIVEGFYAGQTKHWPDNNYWQVISSVRFNIKKEEITNLMLRYKVDVLTEYEHYFGEIPQG